MRKPKTPCSFCGRQYKWWREQDRRHALCDCYLARFDRFSGRFYSYTKLVGECLEWTNKPSPQGYGMSVRFDIRGPATTAHRVAWWLVFGKYPEFTLNHMCENTLCVRVSHLEDVTYSEHAAFTNRYKTFVCPRGHQKYKRKDGRWDCRVCNKERMRLK